MPCSSIFLNPPFCGTDSVISFHPQMVDCGRLRALGLASLALVLAGRALSQPLPSFDFTSPADTAGWAPTHDISSLSTTSTGLLAKINGGDPYTVGPQRDYPAKVPLWLRLKLLNDTNSSDQVFYFSNVATKATSVHFSVPSGQWTENRVTVPTLRPS